MCLHHTHSPTLTLSSSSPHTASSHRRLFGCRRHHHPHTHTYTYTIQNPAKSPGHTPFKHTHPDPGNSGLECRPEPCPGQRCGTGSDPGSQRLTPPARSAPSRGPLRSLVEITAPAAGLCRARGWNGGNWARGLQGLSVAFPICPLGMARRPPEAPLPEAAPLLPLLLGAQPSPPLTHLPSSPLAPPPAWGPGTWNPQRVHLSRPALFPAHPEEPGAVPTLPAHPNPKYPVTRGWHLQLHPCLRSQEWLYSSNTMTQDDLISL